MPDNSRFTIEAFTQHAQRITQTFEKRRVHFLHKLKFRAVVACILLFTFPFWYSLLTRWDHLDNGFSAVGLLVVHVLAAIIIIIMIIAYAVHPLFRYRYDTFRLGASMPGATGVVNQPITLKEQLFTELFKYFGDFRMYSDRKMSLRNFQKAPNIPEFDDWDCNDYIKGHIDGVSVEIAEVKLWVVRETSGIQVFRGLFIVLDINDSNLVLRGKFDGKTVLISKKSAENAFIAEKYEGYKLVNFSEPAFMQKLEALSTVSDEAERLLASDFLRALLKLADNIEGSRNQIRSMDDKIAFALERVAGGLGDVMGAAGNALLNWFRTGRLNTLSARHKIDIPVTQISSSSKAFGSQFQCAFYEDKLLISIPTAHNLFEPDSVFQEPLTPDDITVAHGLMSGLATIVKAVINGMAKEKAA